MELIDNISRLLGDDLKKTLRPGARLKVAASCFSMYAFEALKAELEKIDELDFIFTSPTFVANEVTDKIRKERKEFHIPKLDRERSLYGSEFEIQLRNKLTQRAVAKECADWIRRKAKFKSNRTKAPMQQFACVQAGGTDTAYMPLHGFTAVDLGYQQGNAVSNLVNKMDEAPFAATYAHSYTIVHSAWVGNPSPEITVWFAADGAAGWWWLHGVRADGNSATGVSMRFAAAGATSRRYPSDTHQGLCARYGIWDAWGNWEPAYAKDEDGVIDMYPWTGTWSPFGEGWGFNGKRHAGSPMPKMAVPQFPNRDGGISACILGEFNEILILTDGYAQEEVVVPGWIAMTGNEWDQSYAVPAPDSFTVL